LNGLSGDPLIGAAISYTAALPVAALIVLGDGGDWGGRHLRFMALAAVLVAMAQASRYVAFSKLPVAVASIVIALFPFHTLIFSTILGATARERPGVRHLLAGLLAFLGVVLGLG
jgi:drug/metabolite transporter (DMT)-like permease